LGCSGCTDFLVNTSGTFVGNIISNKVIKEMEKEKQNDTGQEIPKKAL
jgi:GTP-sensing pleiotropic transcriptional regulator CodY